MRNVIGFSIRRPVFTLVSMTLLLLLGFVSLTNIPLKLIPDIDPPIAVVVTSYDQAGPEEVVDRVTRPMENSLSTIQGLNNVSSISSEGSSLVLMEFSWTTSIEDIENDIIQRMNQTPLPSSAGRPQFLKFDPSQLPIIQLSLSTINEDDDNFSDLVVDLENELLKIDGIANIDLLGDAVDQIDIRLDQNDLEDYGLSQNAVVQTLQSHNVTAPGGVVSDNGSEISTRILYQLHGIEDVEDIVLTSDPESGDDVVLSDVASVNINPEPIDTITRTNQEEAILMNIQQQSDANTANVARAFTERLNELLEDSKYSDLDQAVLFNQGEYVDEAIANVALALVAGGIIAMVVLFLFLRNLKTPLLIGIAIPFSVIVTFVLLYFTDFSLNIMTLGGLALGIGMLVDNSIVVIENIYRHLNMKKDPKKAALDGASEVATAITASTLTTVSVFLPVVFISGIVGNLFREFALTVAFSLLASLLVALTVVPMLASKWLKAPKEDEEKKRAKSKFVQTFDSTARWSLKHRLVVILITFGLLGAGAFGITTVGVQFLPATDEGFFQIEIENEPGTPLDSTYENVEEIEEILDGESDVLHYTSVTGSGGQQGPGSATDGSGNEAIIYVTMVSMDDRTISTMDFADDIRRDVERAVPDGEVSIGMDASFGTEPNTFSFDLNDANPVQLEEVANDLYEDFEEMNEFSEVSSSLEETIMELQLQIDDEAAREAGLSPAQIASTVDNISRGVLATQIVTEENQVYEVHVRYDDEYTDTIEALENLSIQTGDGTYIALSELAEFEEGDAPETINRINLEESVQFTLSYTSDNTLNEINELVQDTVDSYGLPDETSISYTGDQQLLEDAISDLTLALILAVVFVYLVMAAQFESLRYPFVIMFSVPLVIIGVAIALTVTRTPVSITAIIGLIVLVGIVVNNAIVLVDYINQRKADGMRSMEAIIQGVKDRARPILMTASTTILALVPLALGFGEGSEIQQPMAITVIGGMISATFLTLFLIPVLYSLLDKDTRYLNRKFMTPDGQVVPAYLLEESYSDEQGQSRRHFGTLPQMSEERQASKQPDTNFSDFYRPVTERPKKEENLSESWYDDTNRKDPDVSGIDHANDSERDTFMYSDEISGKLPPRKVRHSDKDISKEDMKSLIEELKQQEKRNKRDED